MKILEGLPTFTEIFRALMSKERNLGKDALTIYLFQALSLVIGVISSIIIARTLGPSGKGILDLYFLLIMLIVEFGLLGVNSGLLYYLANQHKPLAEVHGSAIAYSLVSGVLVATIGISLMHFWQSILPGLPTNFILLAFLLSPFLFYGGLWANLMTGVNLAPIVYKVQFFYSSLSVLGIVFLWWKQILTSGSAIYLSAVICLLSGMINFIILGRNSNFQLHPSRPLLSDSLKYGLKIYPGFIANWLHFRVDQLMINWFIGVSGVGLYALSVRWAEMLWLIGFGIINAGLYRISSEDKESSYILTKKLFKLVFILSGSAGLVLALLSTPLFGLFYGEPFNASVLPLIILIPGVVAWDAGRVLSQHISFNRGKPYLCTMAALIGMVVNIGGNLFAIPRWGINGAAATSTISYILVIFIMLFFFWRLREV